MESYIIFFIVNIAIDMGLLFSMKTIFKLSIKKINLLFLDIFNVINMVIYKYFEIKFYQFILIKLAICLIIILLITDTYKFKNLTMQYMTILILMFSYFIDPCLWKMMLYLILYVFFLLYRIPNRLASIFPVFPGNKKTAPFPGQFHAD